MSPAPSPAVPATSLSLQGFGLAFGARVVLAECDLELPEDGIDVLMGPVKTGKSSLLRSLAGQFEGHPIHRCWGRAWLRGSPLQPGGRPQLVGQHAGGPARTVFEVLRTPSPAGDVPGNAGTGSRRWVLDCLDRYRAADLIPELDRPLAELSLAMQRRARILALLVSRPGMIFVDEPTYGLDPQESTRLLAWLRHVGGQQKLLVVLHNQQQARMLADSVVLLGGGRVLAHQPTDRFFASPANEWVEQFIRSGSLSLPSPDARAEDLAADAAVLAPLPPAALAAVASSRKAQLQAPEPVALLPPMHTVSMRQPVKLPPTLPEGVELASMVGRAILRGRQGPQGFRWIVPGVLAGCPQPGVVAPIEYDLDLLAAAGISHLITLTERDLPQHILHEYGLANTHLPIFDRQAPSAGQMQLLLVRMQRLLQAGEVLAVHCLAGLGRTGLVLAAWLVRDGGLSAVTAIERLRCIDPAYVQTEVQEVFLREFEEDLTRRML